LKETAYDYAFMLWQMGVAEKEGSVSTMQ